MIARSLNRTRKGARRAVKVCVAHNLCPNWDVQTGNERGQGVRSAIVPALAPA
jgi:hypothetical protein